ncbi:MAG: acyl-CoA thioesterase II [Myxococcota bacterium]
MNPILRELVELLGLERLEENLFRGQSQDLGWGNVFGGQVLGQALSACQQTVPEGRLVHSLHGYFLRTGDARRPIVYEVDPIRDGKSFTTRRVRAIQGGRAIFNLSASFQKQEAGFEHQDKMPETPDPDSLLSERELAQKYADRIPEMFRKRALAERPIEAKPVERNNPLQPQKQPAYRRVWYRAVDALPDALPLHQYLLAYASDFNFLGTTMNPHGVSWLQPNMQVASLDHAMWFHRPFRMDEWLLYEIDSPSASGARGLARGKFFSRDGRLVASCVQEGLIRRWEQGR